MFVCCPEKEAKKRVNKLNDLKNLVHTIEEKMLIPCSLAPPCCQACPPPPCPPTSCHPCCPPCCVTNLLHTTTTNPCPVEPPKEPRVSPDIMVCYKHAVTEKKRDGRPARRNPTVRAKRAKSRELRSGILHVGCDCEKRNGLQDDCRRTDCMGSPECLTKPEPTCGPSEFCDGKHLYKKYEVKKGGDGDANANDDDVTGKVTFFYNCYPAMVKC
ncbi:hypothetical protein Zmor_025814 [Zophobas morio]|uniref:Uncharacterized protein n=1 Tax=Zophobas morio TaxID=2755281 RepID=A0AA38HSC2_9CUCU|nr:hypothetical protein Zmor_025814 [Zophobas morio]